MNQSNEHYMDTDVEIDDLQCYSVIKAPDSRADTACFRRAFPVRVRRFWRMQRNACSTHAMKRICICAQHTECTGYHTTRVLSMAIDSDIQLAMYACDCLFVIYSAFLSYSMVYDTTAPTRVSIVVLRGAGDVTGRYTG
jgi:hypothetical protein